MTATSTGEAKSLLDLEQGTETGKEVGDQSQEQSTTQPTNILQYESAKSSVENKASHSKNNRIEFANENVSESSKENKTASARAVPASDSAMSTDGTSVEPITKRVDFNESSSPEAEAPAQRHPKRESVKLRKAANMKSQFSTAALKILEEVDSDEKTVEISDSLSEKEETAAKENLGFFKRLFLNPSYSIRTQMLLSFGSVSGITILFIMIITIIATVSTGNRTSYNAAIEAENLIESSLGSTARFVAEAVSPILVPKGALDMMTEFQQDRFAGYPNEDESEIPFFDTLSGTNVYPLTKNLPPFEWDFRHTGNEEGNVNGGNFEEHVQGRWPWYHLYPRLSTADACFIMQGACDPRAENSSELGYYPNCTEENNNLTTGGVVAPTPTNAGVARKAAVLSPLLKALYEYHQDIKDLGYYFANGGAGFSMFFPQYESDWNTSYISIGCDWMREPNPINPDLGPIGKDEEIERCHPNGTSVSNREYNPLERAWCRDLAINPNRMRSAGPFRDAWENVWVLGAGRAVYDSITGSFVSCISITLTVDRIQSSLNEVGLKDWSASTTLARWDDGTIIVSPNFNYDTASETTTVFDSSLGTGVDRDSFNSIKSLVDFSQPWDPDDAQEKYQNTSIESENLYLFAYPIPAIPDAYDPNYFPEFVCITTSLKSDVMTSVDDVSNTINEEVKRIIFFILLVGIIGVGVIFVAILTAAFYLTEPLKWMNSVGKNILHHFGEVEIDFERKQDPKCSPKTELNTLVNEFTEMISHFSGKGTAKLAKRREKDVLNEFDSFVPFPTFIHALYSGRKSDDFPFNYNHGSVVAKELTIGNDGIGSGIVDGNDGMKCKINLGHNVHNDELLSSKSTNPSKYPNRSRREIFKSSLFRWIVALIILPLFFFSLLISIFSLWSLSTFPQILNPLKEEFVALETNYTYSATMLRASLAAQLTEEVARDLHVATRYANWIAFGALNTSNSYTEIIGGAQECQDSDHYSMCSWLDDQPCDCAWNDIRSNRECKEFTPSQPSRPLQKLWFGLLKEDSWPDGTRNFTSYPDSGVATSPNATEWWSNVSVLPDEGRLQSRFSTSYQRAKTFSAMSSVLIPLHNHNKGKDRIFEYYLTFEADGMSVGYSGCAPDSITFPFWKSTNENAAFHIRRDLCPEFKYGYDPRCRGWYDESKALALRDSIFIHVNSPFLFQDNVTIGQTITASLINASDVDSFIGQIVASFEPKTIINSLVNETRLNSGVFPILVTVPDMNAVVGPGYSFSKGIKTIEDLVLIYGCDAGSDCEEFHSVLDNMKAGENGTSSFTRLTDDGETERVYVSYSPVFVQYLHAVDSSDLSRGVNRSSILLYSLAFAEREEAMLEQYESVEEFVHQQIAICIAVLSCALLVALLLLLFIVYQVASTSIVGPILSLLRIIQDVNRSHKEDHLKRIHKNIGSCKEVDSIFKTMEMLYTAVQSANLKFYGGDLTSAYQCFKNSLRVFTKLKNKKALAIASTNLGNTLLTAYRVMVQKNQENLLGMSKKEIASEGENYYSVAIKLGEEEYDRFYEEQGWSEECLAFMQSLANRYFHRGLFVLTCREITKKDEALGFRDIQITSDMDLEIVDQCTEMGFKIDRVERHELMLSRSRGINALIKLGYSPEDFFIDEIMKELLSDFRRALKNPGDELFRDLSPAGRMQILDVELMKYCKRARKKLKEAAKVAIRMIVEDEYIFPTALLKATKTLLSYLREVGDDEIVDFSEKGGVWDGLTKLVQEIDANVKLQAIKPSEFNNSISGSVALLERYSSRSDSKSLKASTPLGDVDIDLGASVTETGRGDFNMEEF